MPPVSRLMHLKKLAAKKAANKSLELGLSQEALDHMDTYDAVMKGIQYRMSREFHTLSRPDRVPSSAAESWHASCF